MAVQGRYIGTSGEDYSYAGDRSLWEDNGQPRDISDHYVVIATLALGSQSS